MRMASLMGARRAYWMALLLAIERGQQLVQR